jgi:hypothetical protein
MFLDVASGSVAFRTENKQNNRKKSAGTSVINDASTGSAKGEQVTKKARNIARERERPA